ncbi:hypothetical protein Cal7507_2377 [Calothrix sp. PCC 7507]|nr:hypothetical protein Cal7507_2377 [Calothrix sp. PCC 7507]
MMMESIKNLGIVNILSSLRCYDVFTNHTGLAYYLLSQKVYSKLGV